MPRTECLAFKGTTSRTRFDKIMSAGVDAVLLVNPERRWIPGYVGPITFAEAAVAFAMGKRIYLTDAPDYRYRNESLSWNAVMFGAGKGANGVEPSRWVIPTDALVLECSDLSRLPDRVFEEMDGSPVEVETDPVYALVARGQREFRKGRREAET